MPKRKRPPTPQGAPRKRRPVRRPEFAPEPQPETRTDLDGNPIFADEGVAAGALAHYGSAGPVETRPHWIQQQERVQGRRLSQLRRSTREETAVARAGNTGQLPVLDRSFVMDEVRRVAITTVALLSLIVVLAIVLR